MRLGEGRDAAYRLGARTLTIDAAGHSHWERARFVGCSELLHQSFSFAMLVPLGPRSSRAGKGMAERRRHRIWSGDGGATAVHGPSRWWSGAEARGRGGPCGLGGALGRMERACESWEPMRMPGVGGGKDWAALC
jgi:hypothetical protein